MSSIRHLGVRVTCCADSSESAPGGHALCSGERQTDRESERDRERERERSPAPRVKKYVHTDNLSPEYVYFPSFIKQR